ncbi:MAG TPA: c-type cytochrome [Pyrinomonadaceae bacterium]|nr:c-type cytochrome [Pyrinomonadaceae bacterium]
MRKVIISVISTVVVIAAVIGGFLIYIRGTGFSAREQPSWMEKVMAQNARKIATPADAKSLKNPRQQQSEEMIAEADEHFVEHCSTCHGIDGRGDTTIGKNLYPRVPDITMADTQQLGDGELYYIIYNGIRLTGMPAWGSEDKPEAIWDLVSLIRRLPKLSPEELKRLQQTASESGEQVEEKPGEGPNKEDKSSKQAETQQKHKHTHKH